MTLGFIYVIFNPMFPVNTYKIGTAQNFNNNIIMIDFGKENLQIIDRSEFVKIVKNNKITGVKITDELLKAIQQYLHR